MGVQPRIDVLMREMCCHLGGNLRSGRVCAAQELGQAAAAAELSTINNISRYQPTGCRVQGQPP